MAKMANSITDNAANLAVKATLRNQSPIIVAVSTNDGLGLSGQNIMTLINLKCQLETVQNMIIICVLRISTGQSSCLCKTQESICNQ